MKSMMTEDAGTKTLYERCFWTLELWNSSGGQAGVVSFWGVCTLSFKLPSTFSDTRLSKLHKFIKIKKSSKVKICSSFYFNSLIHFN